MQKKEIKLKDNCLVFSGAKLKLTTETP